MTTAIIDEKWVSERLSALSLDADEEQQISEKPDKDPRKIARKYQLDLCKKALEENVVVYLETGCGKTHIAILLIYEMGHLIKKPQKNICIFLAPSVALVQQQAKVIENSIDFKVGAYCGGSKKSLHYWEKEVEEYEKCGIEEELPYGRLVVTRSTWDRTLDEVLVMTPQILLHNLSHCFIKIELIALLIFDECHYAQLESDHPYAEIMKIFYKMDVVKLPRIFGMTASPILGKGGSIDGLEALLRSKVCCVEDKDELEKVVISPKVNVYYYNSSMEDGSSSSHMIYSRKLEEIKHQSMSALRINSLDPSILRSTKKLLQKLHCNLIFCLENLGLRGALQAGYIFLKGDNFENSDMVEEESSSDSNPCNKYLHQVVSVLDSDCTRDEKEADSSSVEVLKQPYFSKKLLRLIEILSSFRLQPDTKCIIFVNRIVTARSLSHILRNLNFLSAWKCDFLVGVHAGLVSRRNTNTILDKFRSGELNLLVATKVGEEGLDIQTCCLVIRFDLPETVASFIQSRGRARMPQSEYAFLVDRGNLRELNLIEDFKKDEALMNEEISLRKSSIMVTDFKEITYKVDTTGATISSVMSISLLHRYCSKLPHDEYFHPKPQFFYYDDPEGMVCSIILPANAPIHQIVSSPQSSTEAAKKDACLRACKALHEIGALTDYLLPEDDKHVELTQDLADSDDSNEEDSRAELHEMLVPEVLKKPWTDVENSTFSCYYIEISPTPADREYRRFGLYMKEPLPVEAGKMKVDLCLARGRMVRSQLIPCGVTIFNKEEIAAAEMFQQMCLKVILDRHKFVPEYVSLENDDDYKTSSSTFYLLLPLHSEKHGRNSVDWALVKRCLSSPVFKHPCLHVDDQTPQSSKYLHLANGYFNLDDVVGSLVYVPYTNLFFFISDVLWETNGFSLHDDGSKNHVKHYKERSYPTKFISSTLQEFIEVGSYSSLKIAPVFMSISSQLGDQNQRLEIDRLTCSYLLPVMSLLGYDIDLAYPDQPLLKAKQLFVLDNLLRKKKLSGEWREKEEHFIKLPPEACQLKVIGFSKDVGSSLSLLPSIMHRLENFLVAIELKDKLVDSFPEGAEVTAARILEALTTEKCSENFSLERLEVLGDAFLKFAVGRCLFLKHDALDEGQLTRKRSNIVNNSNLLKLARKKRLQVFIRDQPFEPGQFFPFGRPCPLSCTKENQESIHSRDYAKNYDTNSEVRCSKCHHWLFNKTIADAIEALTGAFIVDSGFKAAAAFLNWIGIEVDVTLPKLDNICSASQRFLPLSDQIDVNALENTLGYKFAHKGLLIQAFLHPSFNNSFGGCYQRLEFLGDAVLDYLITSYLYSVYPSLQPGHLTDLRSACVSNSSFADVAGKWSFHKFIICDSSVLCEAMAKYVNNLGRSGKERIEDKACPKALGDLVESFTGALYLDSGFDLKHVWKTILFLLDPIISISKLKLNPLREIYEFCQSYNWELEFSSLKKENKFTVEAKVIERNVSASATNISRKAAKRVAAKQLFECLKAQGYKMKSESLEEVLRKSEAREAKLIGYDETPSTQTAESTTKCKPLSGPIELLHRKSPEIRVTQSIQSNSCRTDSPITNLSRGSSVDSNGKGAVSTVSAKSRLYELCTANCWKPPVFECCCWKPPVFECCEEAGPSHLKEFTFKVLLEIEELPNEAFEFYGEPRARKKDASEQAAEAALFYLENEGYVWDKKRDINHAA